MIISSPITTDNTWETLFEDETVVLHLTQSVFPAYLQECRWFAAKAIGIKQVHIYQRLTFEVHEDRPVYMLILEVMPQVGLAQRYFLALAFVPKQAETDLPTASLITAIVVKGENGLLADALFTPAFRQQLFIHLLNNDDVPASETGVLRFLRGAALKSLLTARELNINITSRVLGVDQSNTSVVYNEQFFLKIYRRLFSNPNPDSEVTYFLTERVGFKYSPKFAGSITLKQKNAADVSVALMQERIDNKGDAWPWLLEHILQYFKRIEERQTDTDAIEQVKLLQPMRIRHLTDNLVSLIGFDVLKKIQLLARRTAQMHIALSADKQDTRFAPQTFNSDYTVWLKNRLLHQFNSRCELVEGSLSRLSGLALEHAKAFLQHKQDMVNRILSFDEQHLTGLRIRVHGDYHLGQVLVTPADDFVILDFEGEPESPMHDRKVKQSPLKDVAGMFRSFHYAVYATIFNEQNALSYPRQKLFAAGEKYYAALVSVFLRTYIQVAQKHGLDIGYLPEIKYLLAYLLLEKAVYELGYELNYRPTWAIIPLQGVMQLLK